MTGHEHHPGVTDLVQPAVNFLLFAGLLGYFLREPIRTYFRERTSKIRLALQAGAAATREAEALRVQLERDAADLPRLQAQIVSELRQTAERQRELLERQARATAERIRADAQAAAAQEAAGARAALQSSVVERALAEAVRLVRGAITSDDQSRFVQEFVQSARGL